MRYINLKIPEHSYFFGFVQTDGNLDMLSRNREHLAIEIKEEDGDILKSFKELFPSIYSSVRKRTRNTNFQKSHKSYTITSDTLTINDLRFRNELNKLGIPYGKKSQIISSPKGEFCERDYIRGLVDGDGSVGITDEGFPFVSFTVKSKKIKEYLFDIIERITGERKRLNRNKRDNIYNIMVNREKAQKLIKHLYYPGCLVLRRKLKKAKVALRWKRPKGVKRVFQKFWEKWEEKYILTHTMEESCDYLKRTESSVKNKLWDLKH